MKGLWRLKSPNNIFCLCSGLFTKNVHFIKILKPILCEAGCLKWTSLLLLPSALFGYRSRRIQRSGNCVPFKFSIPPPLCRFNRRVNCDCNPPRMWIIWDSYTLLWQSPLFVACLPICLLVHCHPFGLLPYIRKCC